jgi:hypothetical protein
MKELTAEEVRCALDNIRDLKAPGLDGMPSLLYKNNCDIVGHKIMEGVLQVLNGGDMLLVWNDTSIMLIPKVTNPMSMEDPRQ